MSNDFLPRTDDGMAGWAQNFQAQTNTLGTATGLTLVQISSYGDKTSAYLDALAIAKNPSTRGGSVIRIKDNLKKELVAMSRDLTRIVQAYPGTTDQMRYDLGITVKKSATPSPIWQQGPVTEIKAVNGRTVTLSVHMQNSKTKFPPGQKGLTVFMAISPTQPTISQWQSCGVVTKSTFPVPTGAPDSATTVWFCCQYFNGKGETSPCGPAVSVNLPESQQLPKSEEKIRVAA